MPKTLMQSGLATAPRLPAAIDTAATLQRAYPRPRLLVPCRYQPGDAERTLYPTALEWKIPPRRRCSLVSERGEDGQS
ncbi:hypothetical protein N7453_012347 [Penicillium expansum]|nr:hypothetical protein N7453_012347 [Penicillium expansum]